MAATVKPAGERPDAETLVQFIVAHAHARHKDVRMRVQFQLWSHLDGRYREYYGQSLVIAGLDEPTIKCVVKAVHDAVYDSAAQR